MGLLDVIAAAAGHPDPSLAIAHALGQAPGQPGSPQGPQPLAGPPPTAGPPAGPAGPGGPPGASGGSPAPAPPQPQATQTPPDLGQMFVQLMQRQQASEGFNRGLGMLAAGFAQPRDRAAMIGAMEGQGGDAGSLMGNLMRLQQYNIEQQNLAAYRQALPAMLEQAGVNKSLAPLAMADPTFLPKVLETKLGVGGSPAWQAQMHAENALINSNQPIPWTPGDPDSYNAYKIRMDKEAADQQKDLNADRANFAPAKNAYDQMIADSEALLKTPGLDDIVGGWTNQHKSIETPGLASTTQQALALYNKIMGNQYASGVQDFKGAGRITQQELKQDLPGQSTMANRAQSPEDFRQGVQDYIAKLQMKRAQLYGQAGQLANSDLSDADYDKYISPIYKPGGSLYVTGQAPRPQKAASPAEAGSAGNTTALKPLGPDDLAQAKTLIARDGRDAVIAHLKANGYDTSGL